MKPTKPSNAILWWAMLGFALMFSAWTVLFVVAAHHRIAEVPLPIQPRNQ